MRTLTWLGNGVGWLASSPATFAVVLRYLLSQSGLRFCSGCDSYPFFLVAFYGVASFVASCVFFVFRVGGRSRREEGDPESTSFALKNKDFAVLAVLTCAYHIFFVLALDELYLTAGRVIVSEGLDLFIAFLFSCCIIRRSYKRPWRVIMALLLTIAGVGLFWLVTWNKDDSEGTLPSSRESWTGIIYLAVSRVAYVWRGMLSKYFQVKRSHAERVRLARKFESDMAKSGQELPAEFFLNSHLFYGADEMELTHLDQIFDDPMYDSESFGHDWKSSFEIFSLGGNFVLTPAAISASVLAGHTPSTYDEFPDAPATTLILLGVLAVLFLLRPFFVSNFLLHSTSGSLVSWRTCYMVVGVLAGVLLMNEPLSVAQVGGLFLVAAGMSFMDHALRRNSTKIAVDRNIENIREHVPLALEDIKAMRKISSLLGQQTFTRVSLDMALNDNPKAWVSTAAPSLNIRRILPSTFTTASAPEQSQVRRTVSAHARGRHRKAPPPIPADTLVTPEPGFHHGDQGSDALSFYSSGSASASGSSSPVDEPISDDDDEDGYEGEQQHSRRSRQMRGPRPLREQPLESNREGVPRPPPSGGEPSARRRNVPPLLPAAPAAMQDRRPMGSINTGDNGGEEGQEDGEEEPSTAPRTPMRAPLPPRGTPGNRSRISIPRTPLASLDEANEEGADEEGEAVDFGRMGGGDRRRRLDL